MKRCSGIVACVLIAVAGFGAAQFWNDEGSSKEWSTTAANWFGGSVWLNGNHAFFTGKDGEAAGTVIEVAGPVEVAGMTFETNGYQVVKLDNSALLTISGSPAMLSVTGNKSSEAAINLPMGGSGGVTKGGVGTLVLGANNDYTGVTTISQGILKMSPNNNHALGATGAGNHTVILPGGSLDINGAIPSPTYNSQEVLYLSGDGPDGMGALRNTGTKMMNSGFTAGITLQGDTALWTPSRIDIRSVISGNGYTLTKNGASELAVGSAVRNCKVVINEGTYTYMHGEALGSSDYDTILNGGYLRTWGSHTISERIICNGGG